MAHGRGAMDAPEPPKTPPSDVLRGVGRLVVDATTRLADVVEAMHHNVQRAPFRAPTSLTHGRTRGLTRLVYGSIRTVARLAGGGLDALVGPEAPAPSTSASHRRDILLSALNGVVGDHLARTGNPLAIPMELRRDGRTLALTREALAASYPDATSKLLVLLPGSCMSERLWLRRGHDHGQALARDLGLSPVYLRYNSGLHIGHNGAAFAARLRELVDAWPVPVEDLVLLCHSMGGLVARSACDLDPTLPVRRMVFLGTPHHGSPLERAGNIFETVLGKTPYTGPLSRLGKLRGAGITDLRHGTIDAPPPEHDRFHPAPDVRRPVPLPAGVTCYAVAASLGAAPIGGALLGDGLVPVDSALGRHTRPELALDLPPERCFIARGLGHMDLLDDASVYAQLAGWLAA